jgi:hypothetical protein
MQKLSLFPVLGPLKDISSGRKYRSDKPISTCELKIPLPGESRNRHRSHLDGIHVGTYSKEKTHVHIIIIIVSGFPSQVENRGSIRPHAKLKGGLYNLTHIAYVHTYKVKCPLKSKSINEIIILIWYFRIVGRDYRYVCICNTKLLIRFYSFIQSELSMLGKLH